MATKGTKRLPAPELAVKGDSANPTVRPGLSKSFEYNEQLKPKKKVTLNKLLATAAKKGVEKFGTAVKDKK